MTRRVDPEARAVGLAGSMVKRGLFTEDEVMGFWESTNSWDERLAIIVKEINLRLRERGKAGNERLLPPRRKPRRHG